MTPLEMTTSTDASSTGSDSMSASWSSTRSQAHRVGAGPRALEHGGRHVDADRAPGRARHLRRDEQVRARAAPEVEHDRPRVDPPEQPVVGDAGEALHRGVGHARELRLGVAELLRPRAAGGEDELLVGLGRDVRVRPADLRPQDVDVDGRPARAHARVPTASRYSSSKRARPGVPRFAFVAEAVERRLELRLAPVAAGVGLGDDRRPVERLEVLAEVARALEGGDLEDAALARAELDRVAEELEQVRLAAPQRRGLGAGRRGRREGSDGAQERADQALRGPVQQPDGAAGTADAHELVGGLLVVGREHRADRGDDDVEGLVLEGQVLGVGLDPRDVDAGGRRRGGGPPRAARE